jgi:predicted polyphosphate/ATP-dependent NAD kinase
VITLGIVANPASGKDVRRLVARASVFDNPEKQAIVRRLIAGMQSVLAGAPWQVAYLDDAHGIVRRALADVTDGSSEGGGPLATPVMTAETGSAIDTTRAAEALAELPSAVTVTLGGDGTNRAFALGWRDAPLIPISTGTNNVFPRLMEATVAGAAAALIASKAVPLEAVAEQQKVIRVAIEGERDDLALIDAVLVAERFVGARALLTPENLRSALLTIAEPAAVGITAIGGLISPLGSRADFGMHLEFAGEEGPDARIVNAPIAPGYYRPVRVTGHGTITFQQSLRCVGPGVLAFDGERERVLKPGQQATLMVERTGPRVVDAATTLRLAAERGCFARPLTTAGATAGATEGGDNDD